MSEKRSIANGAGPTPVSVERMVRGAMAFPEPGSFPNQPFLFASTLFGADTLLVAFGGLDRVGATAELTGLFRDIDPEVTIKTLFGLPIDHEFNGQFFLIKHTVDPRRLVDFKAELDRRFGEIPRDLPSPRPGPSFKFEMDAPEAPGVLHRALEEVKRRGWNIIKLFGKANVRDVAGRPKPFARFRFKVEFPFTPGMDFDKAFADFKKTVEEFGPEWEVRLKGKPTSASAH